MQVLILRLQGPMMSFGDVAIDELRPTRRLPGHAMLTGLVANALGFDHREVERLQRLQDRIRFAARLDAEGRDLLDYQTAEIGKKDPIWRSNGVYKERGGGTWQKEARTRRDVQTVQRYRHYRADAAVTVALTLMPEDEEPDLAAVEASLRRPARPLFIGRKGCPPAGPIFDSRVNATSLVQALEQVPPAIPGSQRSSASQVETEDGEGEPAGRRLVELADRRDWRFGLHAGSSRRRELTIGARETTS